MRHSFKIVTLAFIVLSILRARPFAQQAEFQPPDEPVGVFVVSKPTAARDAPSLTAKVVANYASEEILSVWGARPGWIAVTKGFFDANKVGTAWIPCTKAEFEANLIQDDALEAMVRQNALKNKPWAPAIKHSVLRKRVSVGFTKEQVLAAVGEPIVKETQETASGKTEVWMYSGQSIGLKNSIVSVITKTTTPR